MIRSGRDRKDLGIKEAKRRKVRRRREWTAVSNGTEKSSDGRTKCLLDLTKYSLVTIVRAVSMK